MDEKKHIWLSSPHMSAERYEQRYVQEAFDTNWIAPMGGNVDAFEREICEITGAKDAVALSSGTAAVHLAVKSAGVKEGDVVLCQDLTFAASAFPILYESATPVFIDSETDTWNMDPSALKEAFNELISKGICPKAVVAVNLYGVPAKLAKIKDICREYGAVLIEDAAESLGSRYLGRSTGSFGDYGILSFNGNKIITTSGGGMLLCNTDDAKKRANKARFWATQSREPARHYEHRETGYNYRMSNVCAGIGRGQLRVLEDRVKKKRHIYEHYKEALSDLYGVSFMPENPDAVPNRWLGVMRIDHESISPADVIRALEADDIESRPVWKPMHLQPVFKKYPFVTQKRLDAASYSETEDDGSVSGRLFSSGVCLPGDTKLSDSDLDRVCFNIRALWEKQGMPAE